MARKPSGAKSFPPVSLPKEAAGGSFNRDIEIWRGQLNGHVSLGTGPGWSGHLDGEIIKVTPAAANTDFPVNHNLGRIPVGWLSLSGDGLSRVNATPAHTKSQLWLRATTAGRRHLILVF